MSQNDSVCVFAVPPPATSALRRLDAIALLLLGLTPLSAWGWLSGVDGGVSAWIALGATVLLAGCGLWFAGEAYLARHRTVTVTDEALRLRQLLRDDVIPLDRLSVDGARAVKMETDRDLHPASRTNGLHVEGYRAGRFTLQNGETGLVVLTDLDRVVNIPTRDGRRLLISVDAPDQLLETLRTRQNVYQGEGAP
jgi:hypothetical protein